MTAKPNPFSGLKLTENTDVSDAPLDQRLFSPSLPKPRPVRQTQVEETGKPASWEAGRQASQPATNEGSQPFEINERPFRKNSYLFTDRELEALEDLKIELRRKFDLAATMNDLLRCALHHLVEDYRRQGEAGLAVRRLRGKRSR